jgi:hypothetical protein
MSHVDQSKTLLSREEDQAEEIKVLQKFLPAPIRFSEEPHYIKKLVLMTEIRRHHLLAAGLRMTNLGESEEIVFNQVRFKYSYRRQRVTARITKAALQWIANPPFIDQWVTPFMTSSGQAAVATVLLSLKHHYKRKGKSLTLVVPKGLYWESAETCHRLEIQFVVPAKATAHESDGRVGFIDSSTVDSLSVVLAAMKGIELLIVDTTCWDAAGDEIKLLEKEIKKRPLICLRSHLKLDSLGAEYGSLGSIVAHFPGESEIVQDITTQGRLIGAWSDIDSVYPFLLDADFHLVNSKRNRRLRAAGARISEGLKKTKLPKGITLQEFSHGLFFYLEFSKDSYPEESSLKLERLAKLLKEAELPFMEADSFGFDFLVYKLFPTAADPSSQRVVRFTSPDYCDKKCDKLLKVLVKWMRQIAE